MPKLSDSGMQLVKGLEGWSATSYKDIAGKLTIGYGHLIKADETFDEPISETLGEQILFTDLQAAVNAVLHFISVSLSDNQFSALVSLVYNEGNPPLVGTLGQKLNSKDYQGAAEEFDKWVYIHDPYTGMPEKSKGLIARRAKERALFETADADNDNGQNS